MHSIETLVVASGSSTTSMRIRNHWLLFARHEIVLWRFKSVFDFEKTMSGRWLKISMSGVFWLEMNFSDVGFEIESYNFIGYKSFIIKMIFVIILHVNHCWVYIGLFPEKAWLQWRDLNSKYLRNLEVPITIIIFEWSLIYNKRFIAMVEQELFRKHF